MELIPPAIVVTDLLGVRAIARELKISPGAVSKWRHSGKVPSKYQAKLVAFARRQRKRLTLTMMIFGSKHDT